VNSGWLVTPIADAVVTQNRPATQGHSTGRVPARGGGVSPSRPTARHGCQGAVAALVPSNDSAMSTAPIESKSSGSSINPARKPIRRCASPSGASNGTTFTIGRPDLEMMKASPRLPRRRDEKGGFSPHGCQPASWTEPIELSPIRSRSGDVISGQRQRDNRPDASA
jgi:hypothetical protein